MTMMSDAVSASDAELLRRFSEERSEGAFAELVRRHLDVVHSAALRQVGGDAAAAADVAQGVFIELARQASSLRRHPVLIGWLHTTTHRLAVRWVRTENRRQRREWEAQTMYELNRPEVPEMDWSRLAPVLDAALQELSEPDRLVLLLRHFERRSHAEIGQRLGLGENAARMRGERALDRLAEGLARRGITSTATALAATLGNGAVIAAPAGLASSVTAASLAAVGTASVAGILGFMASAKLKVAVVVVTAGVLGTGAWIQERRVQEAETRRDVAIEERVRVENKLASLRIAAAGAARELARAKATADEVLRLRGELARLRRDAGPVPATTSNRSGAEAKATPTSSFRTTVRTQVPPGQTVVVGGWNWTEGRRGVLFLTPVWRHGDDGKLVVDVVSRIALAAGDTLNEFGLGRFATNEDPEAYEKMGSQQVQELFDRLLQRRDFVAMETFHTTEDATQGAVGMTTDDLADVLVVEVTPTVLPDGTIDLSLNGGLHHQPEPTANASTPDP